MAKHLLGHPLDLRVMNLAYGDVSLLLAVGRGSPHVVVDILKAPSQNRFFGNEADVY